MGIKGCSCCAQFFWELPHSCSQSFWEPPRQAAAAAPELAGDGAKQETGMNNLIWEFQLFIYATFISKLWIGLVVFSFMTINALNFKLGGGEKE